MAALASRSGIAKGTLYLYFETREEVLLALYTERLRVWADALSKGLHDGIEDGAFVELLLATSMADATFLALRARLESVIEHNVSLDRLVESKRMMRDTVAELGPRLECCLELGPGYGPRVLVALGSLLLGASQMDAGPALDGADVPDDVTEFARMFSSSDVFLTHAPVLLDGIRRS